MLKEILVGYAILIAFACIVAVVQHFTDSDINESCGIAFAGFVALCSLTAIAWGIGAVALTIF